MKKEPKHQQHKKQEKHILLRIKHPKLALLIITFVIAYFIFKKSFPFYNSISSLNYLGTFISGILFSYGFTAAPATALLLLLAQEQNIILASIIAGIGSVIGNFLAYKFIKFSLKDEIQNELRIISKERMTIAIEKRTPKKLRHYFIPVLAGFILASPLPDEIAISLFAASHHVKQSTLLVLSFVLHSLGVFVIMLIGSSL